MAKEKIICDTDVMIDYWDEKNPRHKHTTAILEGKILLDNVVLSAITKLELLLGAKNKTDANRINKQLGRFNITLLNDDITLQAFSLVQEYSLSHGLAYPIASLPQQQHCHFHKPASFCNFELRTVSTRVQRNDVAM